MEAGAAGDDLHVAHLGEELGGLRAERLHQHLIVGQTAFQGALHHLGLLVDFLEHVVAVFALVGGFGAVLQLQGLALHLAAFHVPDAHAVAADLGDVALLQVQETVGHLAQGQLVGGQEVFAQAETDHQRAAAARGKDAVRLAGGDHRQAVGAVQFLHGGLERGGQVAHLVQLVVQQVDDDLGVGIRSEQVAQALELLAQGLVILDDAVVYHGNFVAGEMRVGVAFARCAMGGPAGVGDAEAAAQGLLLLGLFQLGDLAGAAQAHQLAIAVDDRDAGAVIAAVFQALEAFEQDRRDV